MARYIDADKLIEHLKDEIKACEPSVGSRANGRSVAYGTKLGLQSAISFAETLAAADVAPKSEDNIPLDVHEALKQRAKVEVAREIFEEIEILMKIYTFPVVQTGVVEIAKEPFWCIESNDFAAIKKKYTEEKE